VAFEVPIATILLIIFGVTTVEKLKKNRPYKTRLLMKSPRAKSFVFHAYIRQVQ
jgi:hypothetical protein